MRTSTADTATVLELNPAQELAQAEAEASRLEEVVYGEMTRLQGLKRELDANLARARRVAEDPALRRFLDELTVPSPGTEAAFNEARAARLKAITARKTCARAVAVRLDEYQVELARVAEQLRDNEQEAQARTVQKNAAVVERAYREQAAIAAAAAMAAADHTLAGAPVMKPITFERDNRRVGQRVALCAEVSLSSESNFFTGFTNDLSDGGVFMATVNLLRVGTLVALSFTLPGGLKVEAKGEVRWVRESDEHNPGAFPGMGIRFSELPDETLRAIHRFVAEREPMFLA